MLKMTRNSAEGLVLSTFHLGVFDRNEPGDRQVASLQQVTSPQGISIQGKEKSQYWGAQLRCLLQESLLQFAIPRMGSRGTYPPALHSHWRESPPERPASLLLGSSTLKKALGQRVFRNQSEICTPQKCSMHLRLEVGHECVRKSTRSIYWKGSICVSHCY